MEHVNTHVNTHVDHCPQQVDHVTTSQGDVYFGLLLPCKQHHTVHHPTVHNHDADVATQTSHIHVQTQVQNVNPVMNHMNQDVMNMNTNMTGMHVTY